MRTTLSAYHKTEQMAIIYRTAVPIPKFGKSSQKWDVRLHSASPSRPRPPTGGRALVVAVVPSQAPGRLRSARLVASRGLGAPRAAAPVASAPGPPAGWSVRAPAALPPPLSGLALLFFVWGGRSPAAPPPGGPRRRLRPSLRSCAPVRRAALASRRACRRRGFPRSSRRGAGRRLCAAPAGAACCGCRRRPAPGAGNEDGERLYSKPCFDRIRRKMRSRPTAYNFVFKASYPLLFLKVSSCRWRCNASFISSS